MAAKNAVWKSFREEGNDLLRGAAGGLIFGTPLLFTMEMWFHGMRISPEHLLGILALVTLINTCFSYASGLRRHNDNHTVSGALADSVTAMAMGAIMAVMILALIGQLNPGDGIDVMIGKIVIEAGAISLGITFTNTKFPRRKDKDAGQEPYDALEDAPLSAEQRQARLDFQNLAAAFAGAVIFSFNVAPTEEIVLIASSQSTLSLLVLLFAQGVIGYVILYAAEFKQHKVFKKTPMQSPSAETVMTVAISLLVSALMLVLIGVDEALSSPQIFIACVITLGLPAVIGGAAGKVVV